MSTIRRSYNPDRTRFLQAINTFAPQVGEELFEICQKHYFRLALYSWLENVATIMPIFKDRRDTWVTVKARTSCINPRLDFLSTELLAWSKRWNLEDLWLIEAAIYSILHWYKGKRYTGLKSLDELFFVVWQSSVQPYKPPVSPIFTRSVRENKKALKTYQKALTTSFADYEVISTRKVKQNFKSRTGPSKSIRVDWSFWLMTYQIWEFSIEEMAYMMNVSCYEGKNFYDGPRLYKKLSNFANSLGMTLREGHVFGQAGRDTFNHWSKSAYAATFFNLYGGFKFDMVKELVVSVRPTTFGLKVDYQKSTSLKVNVNKTFWPRKKSNSKH